MTSWALISKIHCALWANLKRVSSMYNNQDKWPPLRDLKAVFRISLRWPIHVINQVDKTKLSWFVRRSPHVQNLMHKILLYIFHITALVIRPKLSFVSQVLLCFRFIRNGTERVSLAQNNFLLFFPFTSRAYGISLNRSNLPGETLFKYKHWTLRLNLLP